MTLIRLDVAIFFIFSIIQYTQPDSCTCDTATTTTTASACYFDLDAKNNVANMTGCQCKTQSYSTYMNLTTDVMFCAQPTTAATTTASPEATTTCADVDGNGICDYLDFSASLRCYNQTMSSSTSDITWYALIFGSAWIIFWCLLTIIINIVHKNGGHHRFIQLYEELAIIVLMVAVGILNFYFDTYSQQIACKIVGIASHFLMVLVAAAFFFEATFAESMVHGKPKKNGCVPAVLNYIFPLILAAIPAGLTYYFQKENYGTTYRHCFAVLTRDMMWGFTIPVWVLICFATLQAQLACIACDMTRKEQDQAQCFWAKKSAKYLTLVAFLLLSIWLTIMHAGDEQVMYLFILAVVLCIIFGPVLFIAHTSCHINTCKKWGAPSGLKKMYMLCPEREKEKQIVYEEKIVYVDKPVPANPNGAPAGPYPAGASPSHPQTAPVGGTHTQAQHFYSWLYDKKKKQPDANDILFNPKPY